MKPTLLVLAAGMGSRYGGMKQVDPVGPSGEIILDYSAFDAARAGFGKVVFVIRESMRDMFEEQVGASMQGLLQVEYAFQKLEDLPQGFSVPEGREKPWGTTHAILAARDLINEPFCVINADDFYGAEAFRVIAEHLQVPDQPDYAMAGYRLRNTLSEHGSVSRGICACSDGNYLETIREMTKIYRQGSGAVNRPEGQREEPLTGDEYVSMNCWAFYPVFMEQAMMVFTEFLEKSRGDLKAECYIPDVIQGLINSGEMRTKVLPTESTWYGITYKEDKPAVEASIRELVEQGEYPSPLWG